MMKRSRRAACASVKALTDSWMQSSIEELMTKLGGFLARKRDGEPGWQTLWRGWNYLYPRFDGYLLGQRCG
jgi:hypothetical protein